MCASMHSIHFFLYGRIDIPNSISAKECVFAEKMRNKDIVALSAITIDVYRLGQVVCNCNSIGLRLLRCGIG